MSNKVVDTIVKSNKSRQIGFISVIVLVIGSTIGAGIFLKSKSVLSNTGNSLLLSSFSWVIAAIGVIALALALIEISSSRKDNLSIIGWCKTFNNRFIYKACKNFMFYAYVPLTFFFMPLYVLTSFQDALSGFGVVNNFGTNNDWAIWMVIAILMVIWFVTFSGLSAKMGNIQNWIITSIKFIPLVVVALTGFIILGLNVDKTGLSGIPANPVLPSEIGNLGVDSFYSLSPILGMFASISAIFFAYDGFYTSSGIQTEMKEPKKTPLALVIGLSLVTVIYLIVSMAMSFSSKGGSFTGFESFFKSHNLEWLYGLINLFIAIGIMGIINGYAMWAPRFTEDLIKSNELPFSNKFKNKIRQDIPIVGYFYTIIPAIIAIILFCTIGGLAYIPGGYVDEFGNSYYDTIGSHSTAKMYMFADLMGNWTAVTVFTFIGLSVFGGLLNRRKNISGPKGRIKVESFKYFKSVAIIAMIIVFSSMGLEFIAPFINLILLINVKANFTEEIVWRVTVIVVLFIFIDSMFIPIWIEDFLDKKRNIDPKEVYLQNWLEENKQNNISNI